jgi:gamma-D-glutamyl-L-lysine dipeptidyl-peptidase
MKGVIFGVADLRDKPKFRSERTSQLIYGEGVKVLGSEDGYLKVAGPDRLEAYVQKTLIGDLDGERTVKLAGRHAAEGMQFPFGSYLSEAETKCFRVPKKLIVPIDSGADPTKLAKRFLGVPYLWGGTSDFGYDCSGFTQRLFRYSGIELPRNANWQRDAGAKVKDFQHAKRGDLVFFAGHVGMHLGDMVIIHSNLSHGGVSITDLGDGSDYSKRLMDRFQGIRRFEGKVFT